MKRDQGASRQTDRRRATRRGDRLAPRHPATRNPPVHLDEAWDEVPLAALCRPNRRRLERPVLVRAAPFDPTLM